MMLMALVEGVMMTQTMTKMVYKMADVTHLITVQMCPMLISSTQIMMA